MPSYTKHLFMQHLFYFIIFKNISSQQQIEARIAHARAICSAFALMIVDI